MHHRRWLTLPSQREGLMGSCPMAVAARRLTSRLTTGPFHTRISLRGRFLNSTENTHRQTPHTTRSTGRRRSTAGG